MDPGIVLFMGTVRRGEFESLHARGLPLGVLVDTNSKARLGDTSAFALVQHFDFSRPTAELIETVRGIRGRFGLACLFNVVEFYVATTAQVAAALDLPSITPAAARLCLDKNLMRQRFAERIGPEVPARFHNVVSEDDLLAAAQRFGFPVFLQPANVSASMWGTRNPDPATLLANYRTMQRQVPAYYRRLGQNDKVLSVVLSEYLEGPNTSIDCLIATDGQVYTTPAVDVLTGRDVGIDDFHHFARLLPTLQGEAEQADLKRLATAGVRSLDMITTAAHVEFIGTRLGEIAARPGGNRPRILEMAFGIDMLYAYYQVLCGHPPDLRPKHHLAAAVVTPFPASDGVLQTLRHLDRVVRLPGYLYHEIRARPGQAVGLSKSGYRAPLYIELVSSDAGALRGAVDEIASWNDLYVVE